MKYELIDCCPTPSKLLPELKAIKDATGCVYASIYRGTDSRTLLEQCGKHDQKWLFENLPPGQANPPGASTHELFNDGVAYTWPAHVKMSWWHCGIDVDDAHVQAACDAARARGWIVTITYPTSPVEHHHINFRKRPIINLFKPLKLGSDGPRVKRLTQRLARLHPPPTPGQTYMEWHGVTSHFTDHVEKAVKHFQSDHLLAPDGVVDSHTNAQLRVAWRRHSKHQHE
jgi:hypothetical protein